MYVCIHIHTHTHIIHFYFLDPFLKPGHCYEFPHENIILLKLIIPHLFNSLIHDAIIIQQTNNVELNTRCELYYSDKIKQCCKQTSL